MAVFYLTPLVIEVTMVAHSVNHDTERKYHDW